MQVLSEKWDYRKYLAKEEKNTLNNGNTLFKTHISYRPNGQIYWSGPLKVEKINKDYKFTPQGNWKQFYDNGALLATIEYDDKGLNQGGKIYEMDGRIAVLITERKDSLENSPYRFQCIKNGFYDNGQVMQIERWIIINNKTLKHGQWQYFNEDGSISKSLNFVNGKEKR